MTIALDAAEVRMPRGVSRALLLAGFVLYAALLAAAWWAVSALIPDRVPLTLAGHAFAIRNIHDKLLGNAALMLMILPSALWLECAMMGWEKSSLRALLAPT